MRYHVNPTQYSDIFVLPKNVVTQHLKLAGAAQLKVLLWLFAHGGSCEDTAALSADIGLSESDVNDAMQYWVVHKIVLPDDPNHQKASAAPQADVSPEKDAAGSADKEETEQPSAALLPTPTSSRRRPAQKPTRYEISRRSVESPEIAWLLKEAQNRFGRPLSTAEMSTLIWLFDSEGLPPAIILMAVEYAVSQGNSHIRFIETTALSWIDKQIDTVEKAEQHLVEMERRQQDWFRVSKTFGIDRKLPTKQEEIYITRWVREWRFSQKMLKEAYDRAVDSTGKISFAYINKILLNWHDSSITKPEEIEKADSKKPASKKSTAGDNAKNKSYDMDEVHNLLFSKATKEKQS